MDRCLQLCSLFLIVHGSVLIIVFIVPNRSWKGSYSCLTSLSATCTTSFQFNLTNLITITNINLTAGGSCDTVFLRTALNYVNTSIITIRQTPTIPAVVRQTFCKLVNLCICACEKMFILFHYAYYMLV